MVQRTYGDPNALFFADISSTHARAHARLDGSATYLGLLAGLAVCPVGLIVQLLGDNTQELSLVFVAVVVRGADADQLARHDDKDEQLKKKKKRHATE